MRFLPCGADARACSQCAKNSRDRESALDDIWRNEKAKGQRACSCCLCGLLEVTLLQRRKVGNASRSNGSPSFCANGRKRLCDWVRPGRFVPAWSREKFDWLRWGSSTTLMTQRHKTRLRRSMHKPVRCGAASWLATPEWSVNQARGNRWGGEGGGHSNAKQNSHLHSLTCRSSFHGSLSRTRDQPWFLSDYSKSCVLGTYPSTRSEGIRRWTTISSQRFGRLGFVTVKFVRHCLFFHSLFTYYPPFRKRTNFIM